MVVWNAFSRPVAQLGYPFLLGAVITAEHAAVLLQSMTHDTYAAMPAEGASAWIAHSKLSKT